MKKLSLFGIIFLLVSIVFNTNVFAATDRKTITFAAPQEELQINMDESIVLYFMPDGTGIITKESAPSPRAAVGSFRMSLHQEAMDHAYITWTLSLGAGYTGITHIEAELYCKSTAPLFPSKYYNHKISENYNGTSMSASRDTGWFQIPSNVKKVYVGWKNLKFNTLTGKYTTDDARSVVVTG